MMRQRPHHVVYHILIAFQEPAHDILECIILPHQLDIL